MEPFNEYEGDLWPESPPQLPLPSPTPPPPPVLNREPTPWETLQQLEDERLAAVSAITREILYEHVYAHLQNEYIDWELEGMGICRVVGMECYGRNHGHIGVLQKHLGTLKHLEHNAAQDPRELTPSARRNYVRRLEVEEPVTESGDLEMPEAAPSEVVLPLEIADSEELSPEIADSEDFGPEFAKRQDLGTEIPDSQRPSSEIPDSQAPSSSPGLQGRECSVARQTVEEGDESDSAESVIFARECRVTNCDNCTTFTVSYP